MHSAAPKRRCVAGPATLGDFVLVNRLTSNDRDEWMVVLIDETEIVIADVNGSPGARGIQKAVSIVQSRMYLERRALQLLVPFTKEVGGWRLVTIDFGAAAERQECEFLMCFAFQVDSGFLSVTSPYAEVGFALPAQTDEDPVFILTVRSVAGFSA